MQLTRSRARFLYLFLHCPFILWICLSSLTHCVLAGCFSPGGSNGAEEIYEEIGSAIQQSGSRTIVANVFGSEGVTATVYSGVGEEAGVVRVVELLVEGRFVH